MRELLQELLVNCQRKAANNKPSESFVAIPRPDRKNTETRVLHPESL